MPLSDPDDLTGVREPWGKLIAAGWRPQRAFDTCFEQYDAMKSRPHSFAARNAIRSQLQMKLRLLDAAVYFIAASFDAPSRFICRRPSRGRAPIRP